MENERPAGDPGLLEDIEAAIDDKRDAVVAADATGMIRNEEFITVTELREGELTPPA